MFVKTSSGFKRNQDNPKVGILCDRVRGMLRLPWLLRLEPTDFLSYVKAEYRTGRRDWLANAALRMLLVLIHQLFSCSNRDVIRCRLRFGGRNNEVTAIGESPARKSFPSRTQSLDGFAIE